MVTIKLYNTPNVTNVINKVKNNEVTLTGNLIEPTDMENPTISVIRDDSLLNKNYFYIQEFNRYYYRTNIKITGAVFEITGHVDVLESFKNDFMNIVQKIDRQEWAFNKNIVDNDLPLSTEKYYQIIKIGTSPFHVEDTSMAQNSFFPFILNACNVGFES